MGVELLFLCGCPLVGRREQVAALVPRFGLARAKVGVADGLPQRLGKKVY